MPPNKFERFLLRVEGIPCKRSSTDVQVRILHSAAIFLALIRHFIGLSNSFWKITAFLDFHILHSRKEIHYDYDTLFQTFRANLVLGSLEFWNGIQWWRFANVQLWDTFGQSQNKWSVVSVASKQIGQSGSIWQPRFNRVPQMGRALWHIFQRKILIFGIVSIFQIHLKFHGLPSTTCCSCTSQEADLVVKVPILLKPQQKESLISVIGIGIPIIL